MQLLSFSICFAIALHAVVAAPFPAHNQPNNWQLHGPVDNETAEGYRSRITRCHTRKKDCLLLAAHHSKTEEYHQNEADRLGHGTEEGKKHLQLVKTHSDKHRKYTINAADYEGRIRRYKEISGVED